MASTVQQYNSTSQVLNNAIKTADDDLASINAEIKAIQANPTQPNAQSKLDILKERADAVGGAVADVQGKRYDVVQVYNGLPLANQLELKDSLVQSSQATNNVINQVANTNAALAEAQKAVTSGIASGNAQKGGGNNQQDDDAKGSAGNQPPSVGFSTRPRKNPLGQFASYTYQLTIYMITPDAYNAFVESGRKNINALRSAQSVNSGEISGGAFIIAQSGGVNNKYRLEPEFKYDYYIDKLSFTTKCSGDSEMNSVAFNFTIIEPYGFSFLTNIRRAVERITPTLKGSSKLPREGMNQFYILGIRFYGYDEKGNLLTGKEGFNGGTLDPNNSKNGLFEKFYDLTFNTFKFKLDGKATIYNITATSMAPQQGLGTKRGTLKQGVSISAATVEEACNQLINKMNLVETTSVEEPRNTFKIEFIGEESDVKRLKEATILPPNDNSKAAWNHSGVKNTSQVNDQTAIKTKPNPTKRVIEENNGTIINDCIAKIMKQSSYMTDALNTLYAAQKAGAQGQPIINNPNDTELNWYNLSCELKNARFNTKLNDWVFDITYVIQPYKTPAVYSPFISKNHNFYGVHKTYEYYFTGKNSEIISLEQSFDNSFAMIVLNDNSLSEGITAQDLDKPPMVTGKRPDVSRSGAFNQSLDAQNSILSVLYDPTAQVKTKITMLGDPDFLMSSNPSSLDQVYNQFYGSEDYCINPNGGQVFISVNFKEAIDYDESNGYLSVNDDILFLKYPNSIKNSISGVIYQIVSCTSSFDNGKFIQTFTVALPGFSWEDDSISVAQREDSAKETSQQTQNKEDARTTTTKVNSADSATAGSLPKQGDTSKPNTQLKPAGPPPISSDLAGDSQYVAYITDPQTGMQLGMTQEDVNYLSQQED